MLKKIIKISILSLMIITIPVINAQLSYKLTINTDQSQYYLGELVTITGRLTDDGSGMPGQPVCIEIKNPSGTTVHSICTLTDSQGRYNDFYTAEHGIGYYEIIAHADIGATAYDSFNVVTTTIIPNANGPYYGVINQQIEFQGSVNGGKSPYSWLWVFGDGTNTSNDKSPVYSYKAVGNYTITLTAIDKNGYQGETYTFVEISNELIADSNGPYQGPPNITINFKGSAYGGYQPYTYYWTFGDGNNSNEQNPSHIYKNLGEYNINLTVEDDRGIKAYSETIITIAPNYPPNKPSINGPNTGKPNKEYTYSSTTIDPNGNDLYYFWDWGDGNNSGWQGPYYSGALVNISYSWSVKGDYQIRVKTKDIYDAESDWSDPIQIAIPKNTITKYPIINILHQYIEENIILKYLFKLSGRILEIL